MRSCFALFVLLVVSLGCDSSPSRPDTDIPFSTLVQSKVSGATGPQIQTVVRNDTEWRQVWSELWRGRGPVRPAVDFGRDMVVLVTASETCFGGATIEAIEHTGGELRIRYGDAAPTLCLCSQAELAFHAVRIPRVFGDARFEARQTPPLCP